MAFISISSTVSIISWFCSLLFRLVGLILFYGQWLRSPGKKETHFHPNSELFAPSEKKDVITSTACWVAMVALLAGLTVAVGTIWMIKFICSFLGNYLFLFSLHIYHLHYSAFCF